MKSYNKWKLTESTVNPIVAQKIDLCAKTKNQILDLSNMGLTEIPDLSSCPHISLLELQNNKISKIENLDALVNLIFLDLSNNKISKIENINHLVKLEQLVLTHNVISKIENLESAKLWSLELSYNKISKIENINHLVDLQFLNLCKNKIKQFPSNAIDKLSLRCLKLHFNEIKDVSDVKGINVEYINIEYNPLKNKIDFSKNQILKIRYSDVGLVDEHGKTEEFR